MSVSAALLKEFILSLSGKAGTTVDAYQRKLRNFLDWISQRAGNSGPFDAQQQLTKTALQSYLTHLQSEGHSISHCARVKSALGGFARWLIEEKQLLRRNPARGVELPPQPLLDSACNKDKLGMVAIAVGFLTDELSIWREVCRLAARWHNTKEENQNTVSAWTPLKNRW